MHAILVAIGTDGDVLPYLRLGRRLRDRGHRVTLASNASHERLATAEGFPSARMVLLKGVDERGFTFFTNYESRKSVELLENPNAALVFHWAVLERQVRVEGTVTKISEEESLAYYRTRPRGSRIGAWASAQSRPLDARETLEQQVRDTEDRFKGEDPPLPPFWGGFRVNPVRIEFWQGRASRLHDRLAYTRSESTGAEGSAGAGESSGGWSVERLYP